MSKFLNISTDSTLGGSAPSDELAVSQKAIKTYVDNNSGSTYTAGTGIDITDSTISVTAPTVIDYSTNSISMMLSKIAQLGSKNYTGVAVLGASACTYANYTLALGYNAQTDAVGAIQLNASPSNRRNQDANTFKVANANGNFEIMSADGTIPEARLADTTNAAQGQVLTLDNNLNAVWASGGGDAVDSVNGKTGVVVLDASDVGAATAAQGALADTALQSGDNVSELVNDAGYLTQHQTLADLGITATASEINVLDGITASTAELNYTDGVTGNIQTQLNGKQATISDLATIRSGAALGATAVQPGDLATVATSGSYNDLSNKPTIPAAQVNSDWNANSGVAQILNKPTLGTASAADTTDFATAAQGALADTAVQPADLATVATSGSYNDLSNKPTIPTVGNGTITFTQGGVTKGTITTNQAGNTTIALDAGSVDIDNLTITENASNEIQAVAVIDQNTGIIKPWSGTGAEYEDISEIDPDTLYITDDLGLPATEIGQITEALNNKMDIGTPLARDIFSPDEWVGGAAENILAAGVGSGTITFTKNWQEYDYLWFSAVNDTGATHDDSPHWISVKWMLSRAVAGDTNLAVLAYANTLYWYVNPQTWTETTMPAGSLAENSYINRVYAIKLKNITAENVGYLNYVGNFATVAALNAAAPSAMGQWAIVDTDENHSNLQTKYFSTKNISGQFVWSYGGVINVSLAGADYVVESQEPTAANNYTWYRKYKSGWVEQGGLLGNAGSFTTRTITMPIAMFDTNYTVVITGAWGDSSGSGSMLNQNKTTTAFGTWATNLNNYGSWQVSGMAA